MTEKMKAARFYEVGEPLRIDKTPVPELGPGDVLVEINNLGRKNDKKCPPLFSKRGNWCILEAEKVRCDADWFPRKNFNGCGRILEEKAQ